MACLPCCGENVCEGEITQFSGHPRKGKFLTRNKVHSFFVFRLQRVVLRLRQRDKRRDIVQNLYKCLYCLFDAGQRMGVCLCYYRFDAGRSISRRARGKVQNIQNVVFLFFGK